MSNYNKFGRMRGLYRAVLRKEPWALQLNNIRLNHPFQFMLGVLYNRPKDLISELIYKKKPFLDLFCKETAWQGKYFPVPICFGKYAAGRKRKLYRGIF